MKNREDIIKEVYGEIIHKIETEINQKVKSIEQFNKDEIKFRIEKDLECYFKENTILEEELLNKVFEFGSKRKNLEAEINKLKIRKIVLETYIVELWEIGFN